MLAENARGMVLGLCSVALFAVVAAMAKAAAEVFAVLQILFFRQVVVLLSTLPAILRARPLDLRTERPALHLARLLGAFVALAMGLLAVTLLPLSTATALGFVSAFWVALLGHRFLGEPLTRERVAALALGFVGVLLALQPWSHDFQPLYALVPLFGALGAAVAKVSVRALSSTEGAAKLLLYQAVFVGALCALPLPWLWVAPTPEQWLWLAAMGVLAALAQWLGVTALRHGEAGLLAGVDYTALVFASLLGWLFFAELPERAVLLGGSVIAVSSLWLYRLARR